MSKVVISVDQLCKEFTYFEDRPRTLKNFLVELSRFRFSNLKRKKIRVLNNLSFKIREGDFVGLIGKNGVGKSSLLRVICGIYEPTSGTIEVNGKIAPLTAIGAGFHEELSGLENIYLNAAILGFGRQQISDKLNQILVFAGLGELIHMPVRSYSNGMLLRLGFSVAVFLDAPIILLDEVLAVGDVQFQKKCLDKIKELHEMGRTIILVSHSPDEIVKHCNRCIVLSKEGVVYDGDPRGAISYYIEECEQR